MHLNPSNVVATRSLCLGKKKLEIEVKRNGVEVPSVLTQSFRGEPPSIILILINTTLQLLFSNFTHPHSLFLSWSVISSGTSLDLVTYGEARLGNHLAKRLFPP